MITLPEATLLSRRDNPIIGSSHEKCSCLLTAWSDDVSATDHPRFKDEWSRRRSSVSSWRDVTVWKTSRHDVVRRRTRLRGRRELDLKEGRTGEDKRGRGYCRKSDNVNVRHGHIAAVHRRRRRTDDRSHTHRHQDRHTTGCQPHVGGSGGLHSVYSVTYHCHRQLDHPGRLLQVQETPDRLQLPTSLFGH